MDVQDMHEIEIFRTVLEVLHADASKFLVFLSNRGLDKAKENFLVRVSPFDNAFCELKVHGVFGILP